MIVYVNSKPQEMPSQSRLKDALGMLNEVSQRGIAIAINNNVIPRAEWDIHILQAEDRLTIIKATQGG